MTIAFDLGRKASKQTNKRMDEDERPKFGPLVPLDSCTCLFKNDFNHMQKVPKSFCSLAC